MAPNKEGIDAPNGNEEGEQEAFEEEYSHGWIEDDAFSQEFSSQQGRDDFEWKALDQEQRSERVTKKVRAADFNDRAIQIDARAST